MAYPRADKGTESAEPLPSQISQFPMEPMSVAALGIKEDLP